VDTLRQEAIGFLFSKGFKIISAERFFFGRPVIFDLFSGSHKLETGMLSPEIRKMVEDDALRYFTREQLQEHYDEELEFLQSLEEKQPEPRAFKLHVTLESDKPQNLTIIVG
jgi:hypothetical protein